MLKKIRVELFILFFVIHTVISCGQENKNVMIYKNDEIQITFPGEYIVDEIKSYKSNGYFSKSLEHILFCKQEPQPEYVQQVSSESGFLCSMYILPVIEKTELKQEIIKTFTQKEDLGSLSEIEEIIINEYSAVKWRYQLSKTRLDHYMYKTKNHYYLFISSPYGSNGSIEEIISTIKLLK